MSSFPVILLTTRGSLLGDDDDCREHRKETWQTLIRDLESKAVEILELHQQSLRGDQSLLLL